MPAAPLAFFQWEIKNDRLWHDHVLFFYILLARNMNNIRDYNLFHWIRPIWHLMCHYENINQMCNIYYLYLILIPHWNCTKNRLFAYLRYI